MKAPKSNYIRNRVRELKLNQENKKYIDDLIWLEEIIIQGGPSSFAGSMCYHSLKNRYKKEHRAIYLELNPKQFKNMQKQLKKEAEEEKKELVKEKGIERFENDNFKNMWKKCGGKL